VDFQQVEDLLVAEALTEAVKTALLETLVVDHLQMV
jgi:hypothetical protein